MNKFTSLMLLFLLISSSFTVISGSVSATDLVADSWNTKTPMTQARASLGVVAVNNKIYAIGGYTDGTTYVGTNECYDPVTDKWVTLRPMPTPRSSFAVVEYRGKIYCMGGTTASYEGPFVSKGLNVNEVYNIATDSWSTKASVPFTGRISQACVIDEKIYVVAWDTLYMYDPTVDVWTHITNVPTNVLIFKFSAMMDNKILVVDSFVTADVYRDNLWVYDPKTDAWNEMTPFIHHPFDSRGFNFAVGDVGVTTGVYAPSRVCVLGFQKRYTTELSNFVYNPADDTWATAKDMPAYREGFGVVVLDDVLYVIGGTTGGVSNTCALNEQYVPIGYGSVQLTDKQSTDPSELQQTESFLIYPIIVVSVLIVCIVVVSLLYFVFRKRDYRGKIETEKINEVVSDDAC